MEFTKIDKAEILRRLNFESFYRGELGDLRPGRGGEAMALCPFHREKNPSFSLNTETGVFNCFGCGANGAL